MTNKDLAALPKDVPLAPVALPAAVQVEPPPPVAPGVLAANQSTAVALLGDRLVALRAGLVQRDQTAAEYRDACAGKVTSAGWVLRGQLITTPNAQTPVCRTMASDLAQQTTAFDQEHAAIVEAARQAGILPGVLRDLFASHELPD